MFTERLTVSITKAVKNAIEDHFNHGQPIVVMAKRQAHQVVSTQEAKLITISGFYDAGIRCNGFHFRFGH